jgi:RNA polymerase primary sigma factor
MNLESDKKHGDPSKYDKHRVREIMIQSQNVSSIDAPMTTDSDSGTLLNLMIGENEHDIKKSLTKKDLQIEMKRVLNTLSERESKILTLNFGLFGERVRSLEEIAAYFEITRERARQIREKALKKLRTRNRKVILKEYI